MGKPNDWFLCCQANENPDICPCDSTCLCRRGMCKDKLMTRFIESDKGIETCPGCIDSTKDHWHNCYQHKQKITRILSKIQEDKSVRNPKFDRLLKKMQETHDKKNEDYAKGGSPYSNFEEAAAIAGTDVDTVFRTLIGIKLARLNVLLGSGKTPNNESVQDSRLDLAVYATLWASYHQE